MTSESAFIETPGYAPRGRKVAWPQLSHRWVPRSLLQLTGVAGLWSALS